jgi:hypothetical protein
MSRWVRSGTTLAVIVVLEATLAAIVTIHTAGLGRADVCADAGGRQFEAAGGCTDPGAAAPFALPPPEYVPPPREYVPVPPLVPENIHPGTPPVWSTTDPSNPQQTLPSGDSGNVHWEVGNYISDGLQIYGLICHPASAGRHPVLIVNHGSAPGLSTAGIVTATWNGCITMAENGWLVATSTYRGWSIFGTQAGEQAPFPYQGFTRLSGGQFELCGGEVDDVLNLLSAVKALPNNVANPNQVVMYGHSHGSCITELAIERGAAPQIAVSLDGPTDFTQSAWAAVLPQTPPGPAFPNGPVWCPSCGSTFHAQEYARSSVLSDTSIGKNGPSSLAKVSFLRIQSEGDGIVVPEQGCELAAALPSSSSYYYHLSTYTNQPPPGGPGWDQPGTYWYPPKECAPWPTPCKPTQTASNCGPWKLGANGFLPDTGRGGQWGSPTFLMYSCPDSVCTGPGGSPTGNEGATEHGAILGQSWPEVASFVNQFASGWSASFPPQFPFE